MTNCGAVLGQLGQVVEERMGLVAEIRRQRVPMPPLAVTAVDRVAGGDLRAAAAGVVVGDQRRAEIGVRFPERAGEIAVARSRRTRLAARA